MMSTVKQTEEMKWENVSRKILGSKFETVDAWVKVENTLV